MLRLDELRELLALEEEVRLDDEPVDEKLPVNPLLVPVELVERLARVELETATADEVDPLAALAALADVTEDAEDPAEDASDALELDELLDEAADDEELWAPLADEGSEAVDADGAPPLLELDVDPPRFAGHPTMAMSPITGSPRTRARRRSRMRADTRTPGHTTQR